MGLAIQKYSANLNFVRVADGCVVAKRGRGAQRSRGGSRVGVEEALKKTEKEPHRGYILTNVKIDELREGEA